MTRHAVGPEAGFCHFLLEGGNAFQERSNVAFPGDVVAIQLHDAFFSFGRGAFRASSAARRADWQDSIALLFPARTPLAGKDAVRSCCF